MSKRINELPSTGNIGVADLLAVMQGGVTKQAALSGSFSFGTLAAAVLSATSFTATTISGAPNFSGIPTFASASFSGQIKAADGTVAAPSISFSNDLDTGFWKRSNGFISVTLHGNNVIELIDTVSLPTAGGVRMAANAFLSWTSVNDNAGATADVLLGREAAGTLGQRNGTNRQNHVIYGTYTDASNWERVEIGIDASASDVAKISHNKAGTGMYRNIGMHVGGAYTWVFSSAGPLLTFVDNTVDIGLSGANRPRTGYFATSVETVLVQNGTGTLQLGNASGDIQWKKANVALGGGAAPTVGTIGGSGPAVAAQRNWLRFIESDGTASFIPVWR